MAPQINLAFKFFYLLALLVTLAQLVQLAILVVLALTVDPCRTLAATLGAMILFFYIKNTVSSVRKVRDALKAQLTDNYIKMQKKKQQFEADRAAPEATAAKQAGIPKSSLEILEELIDDELERAGFSTGSLIVWSCVTVACALLLASVVVTAQKLFFQEQQQGPAQLMASVTSSAGVVWTQVGKKRKEDKQIQKTIGSVRTVQYSHNTSHCKLTRRAGYAHVLYARAEECACLAYRRSPSASIHLNLYSILSYLDRVATLVIVSQHARCVVAGREACPQGGKAGRGAEPRGEGGRRPRHDSHTRPGAVTPQAVPERPGGQEGRNRRRREPCVAVARTAGLAMHGRIARYVS